MDGTLPFINVVFVILIFLLMAGTIAGTDMREISPAVAHDSDLSSPPEDAVYLHADGKVRWSGTSYDISALEAALAATDVAHLRHMRVYADRDADARAAVELIGLLRRTGAQNVVLVAAREVRR